MSARLLNLDQLRDARGAAAVEFAVLVSFLAILVSGLIDFGEAVNIATELNSSTRAGAQYAFDHPTDTDGITWAVQNASKDPSADMTVTVLTTVPGGTTSPFYCTCGDSDPAAANQVDCNTGLCTSPATKKAFVRVTATQTYTPILPYPGVASTIPISGSAIIQVR